MKKPKKMIAWAAFHNGEFLMNGWEWNQGLPILLNKRRMVFEVFHAPMYKGIKAVKVQTASL